MTGTCGSTFGGRWVEAPRQPERTNAFRSELGRRPRPPPRPGRRRPGSAPRIELSPDVSATACNASLSGRCCDDSLNPRPRLAHVWRQQYGIGVGGLRERDRSGRQQHPDRDRRDHDRAAVKDHLRRQRPGCGHPEIDQEVAQPVREVEERERDEGEQVELHDRVAQDVYPGVVMPIHHVDDAQRPKHALDQDLDREHEGGQPAPIGEEEPPEQVGNGRLLTLRGVVVHRANPMRTAAITTDATSHSPNIVATIARGGTGLPMNLRWMITPARLRKVTLWYVANPRQMMLKTMKAGDAAG